MQTGNLEFILAWASILGAVLGAFGFLHRDMNKKFEGVNGDMNKKFDGVNGTLKEHGEQLASLREGVARIDETLEGHGRQLKGHGEVLKEHGVQFVSLREGVARIEGYLGYGFAGPFGERRADDEPPERAA